jgi:pyruvate dehydrogenase E2 component (dihydrolipoamide acetyltransferase)
MPNFHGHYLHDLSSWRKMAAVAWSPPDNPLIYGGIQIDFTAGRAYIKRRAAESGVHLTPVHLAVKAMADTLHRHPQCNGLIRKNKIYLRDHVDISVLVAVAPDDGLDQKADLSETIIRDADRRDIVDIGETIAAGAHAIRTNTDEFLRRTKTMFERLPPFLTKIGLRLARIAEYRWNFNLRRFGIPRDPFGSLLVTNVGSLGVNMAWAPIPPFSGVPAVISVGLVEDRPVAVNGEVVVRPILPVHATLDHRLIDGYQGGRLAKTFRQIMENPDAEIAVGGSVH